MTRNAAEDRALDDPRRRKPVRDCQPDPFWKADVAYLPAFSPKSNEAPLPVSLLNRCDLKLDQLSPSQTSGEKNGQDRVVPLST
jgi:hypothetical protein